MSTEAQIAHGLDISGRVDSTLVVEGTITGDLEIMQSMEAVGHIIFEPEFDLFLETTIRMVLVVTPVDPPPNVSLELVRGQSITPSFPFEFDQFGRPV